MTIAPDARTLLPLAPAAGPHGSRALATCVYKCAMACYHPAPNPTDNPYLGDIVTAALARRSVLRGALATAAAGAAVSLVASPVAAASNGGSQSAKGRGPRALTFAPVAPQASTVDELRVPDGYEWQTVIAWLDPLFPGAPDFDPADPDPEAQAQRFGYNNDYVGLVDIRGGRHTVMVVNHEYTNEELIYPGWTGAANATDAQLRTSQMAHGMTVVEVDRARGRSGAYSYDPNSDLNRRIHVYTPFEVTGPAAGNVALRTMQDPAGTRVLGTLNNCAGGLTLWGTVMSGEENFNGYFGVANNDSGGADYSGVPTSDAVRAGYARYGVGSPVGTSFWRNWEQVDDRFSLAEEPNEPHRFGWIIEVDPSDPTSTPKKRTALGRFKHEGANMQLDDDGRVVVYMGDDERFDYLYKFVSRDRLARNRRNAGSILDNGTLYVAKFTGDSPDFEATGVAPIPDDGEFDGTGQWIPLVTSSDGTATSHVPSMDGESVLIWTRLAGDAVGATQMDRPEDVEPSPTSKVVYIACTNNTSRRTVAYDSGGRRLDGPTEANPRGGTTAVGTTPATGSRNKDGHVIALTDGLTARTVGSFTWRIALLAGDPDDETTYFDGYDKSQVSPISCPDNVAFDRAGNLWIATDGNALGNADGLFAMPVEGSEKGYLRQFATMPVGAECCGPFLTEDGLTAFVAPQHPGEGGTFDVPLSDFPYDRDDPYEVKVRPAVVAIFRTDGKRIGR